MQPQALPQESENIVKGGMGLGIPCGLWQRGQFVRVEGLDHQDDDTAQAQESRGGPFDSLIAPLPLGLDTEVCACQLKGHFNGPSLDEGGDDVTGVEMEIGGEIGHGVAFATRVTDQDPADVQGRGPRRVPKCRTGGPVDDFRYAIIPIDPSPLPQGGFVGCDLVESRYPLTNTRRSPPSFGAIRLHACGWIVKETGI